LNLGAFLDAQRARISCWLKGYYASLALFVALNIGIRPRDPHFGLDSLPGFWAVFGVAVGIVMVYVMKRFIQPLIVRKEDYYGDI